MMLQDCHLPFGVRGANTADDDVADAWRRVLRVLTEGADELRARYCVLTDADVFPALPIHHCRLEGEAHAAEHQVCSAYNPKNIGVEEADSHCEADHRLIDDALHGP